MSTLGENRKTHWFVDAFAHDYLHRYKHRSDSAAEAEVPFLLKVLNVKRGARVLDLACGAGRHSRSLASGGLNVVALDLSADLLRAAAAKRAQRRRITYLRGDMRRLPLHSEQFDGVVNLFTSFGYFSTERQNQQVVDEAARVLKPGARMVIDFMNVPYVLKHLVAESERRIGADCLTERRWYDRQTKRLIKTACGTACGKAVERFESVRAYTPAELEDLFGHAGLKVIARYGSLSGEKYVRLKSMRCVLVGEKR